jgi:membrane dipeptidase
MNRLIFYIVVLLAVFNFNGMSQMKNNNDYKELHKKAVVVDMHNDLLSKSKNYDWSVKHKENHTDIPRLLIGGIDVQFLAIWVSPKVKNPYQKGLEQAQIFKERVEENKETSGQATNYTEIMSLQKKGKMAFVLCVEGGNVIQNSIKRLEEFYNLGARYMTITWNKSFDWAVAAKDPNSKTKGLSALGKKIIQTMDSLGMIIDVSHTGVKTIDDILKITKNPIIASHSGSYKVRPHYRNLTDEQIMAVAKNGGVIGINFCPPFLTDKKQASIKDVIDHIDYIVKLAGIDHVGLGSDFDGIESTPIGLEDCSKYTAITKALLDRGYSEKDIKKILGENFLRIIKKVCK